MFLDEARIAASLHHSNIVQVHEVDEADGVVFYAMEFLHGHDVRSILRQSSRKGVEGGIPLEHALAIILGVCAGLHYAHERVGPDGQPLHIVHRDVSPHNVFVTFDGGVKVIDFGIAQAANRLSRTQYGTLKGKFGYMSPEQCLGQPLDRLTDVFCISIVLFELTTGRKLFTGDSEYEILKQVVETDATPPSVRVPDYPPELERIVLRGLARDRNRRYATAEELQLALEEFAGARGIGSSPISLARFMEDLFREEIERWRDAQRADIGLAEHVMSFAQTRIDAGPGMDSEQGAREEQLHDDAAGSRSRTETARPALLLARRKAARARRPWQLLVAAAVIGLGAAAALWARRAPTERPPHRQVAAPRTAEPPAEPVSTVDLPRKPPRGGSDH
jgi:serine/threonine protein kinase